MSSVVSAKPRIEREIFDAIFQTRESAIVIDSPPGAGKTYLNESIGAIAALRMNWRAALVTPKRDQAQDLALRAKLRFPGLRVELLHRDGARIRPEVIDAGVLSRTKVQQLSPGPGIVVATIDKLSNALPNMSGDFFRLLVVDEAYQTTLAQALGSVSCASQLVMIGDPGQLEPYVEVPVDRFEEGRELVHRSLPNELLRKHQSIRRFALNATHRLPQDTVNIVQPAFYPALPFSANATDAERRVVFAARGLNSPVDRALDAIGAGASMVVLTLPRLGYPMQADEELSTLAASVARRLLERGARWGNRRLLDHDIGYVDTHVNSVTLTRMVFQRGGMTPAFVNTPEVVQGRQAPIVIAKHPLSGVAKASSFDVSPGRLCVMLSRHQLACIIVTRANVDLTLSKYEHDGSERRAGHHDDVWDGFIAHRSIFDSMLSSLRVFAL